MSFEQAVVQLEQTNAALQEEVIRFRDAAMGLNAIYPTITEGRQAVSDGKYFSVPGGGAYMRLYRRQGTSAELIAEFPDRAQVQGIVDVFGGRGVSGGLSNLGEPSDLVRLADVGFASRARFGNYYSGSVNKNIDEAQAGDCGLYSSAGRGVYPGTDSFYWVETQSLFTNEALFQKAYVYWNTSNRASIKARTFIRSCSGTLDAEGKRIWGDWGEVFTSRNILGTVLHGDGLPTGSIIETGVNANGEYIKFAGGWMICTMSVVFSYNTTLYQTFSFPAAFSSPPSLSKSHTGLSADIYNRWAYVEIGSSSGVTNNFVLLYRRDFNSSDLVNSTETIRVTAIGRYATG